MKDAPLGRGHGWPSQAPHDERPPAILHPPAFGRPTGVESGAAAASERSAARHSKTIGVSEGARTDRVAPAQPPRDARRTRAPHPIRRARPGATKKGQAESWLGVEPRATPTT